MRHSIFVFVLILFFISGNSQNGITITKVLGGVSVPVDIGNCGDDRLFVIEKAGKIRIIQNNKMLAAPFLDIVSKVRSSGNEQGLLGMAFHPNYKNNGYVYVNYTDRGNPTLTVIERYQVTADSSKADSLSGKILLTFAQPYSNHNGGCLKFGKDGYLYIGTGDGGSQKDPNNNGQNKKALLAKMLRIDVDTSVTYKIPKSNPFVKDTSYIPEIWALGMRNPWRFSFDRLNGDLWIADVGQDTWEEIDFEPGNSKGGRNYGWRCYEGNHVLNNSGCNAMSGYDFPLHEYIHDNVYKECSIIGGYVYRGNKYPTLFGKYVYCDYCSGRIRLLNRLNDTAYTDKVVYDYTDNAINTFGEDTEGNIYFADAITGSIYKIGDTCRFNFKMITTDETCAGMHDGSAKTDLKSGLNASFNWSNGDTTESLNNLSPGTYHVKVNYNQCLSETDFIIHSKTQDSSCIQQPAITEICEGDSILLNACVQGKAVSYKWYRDSVLISGESSNQLNVKTSGNYQLAFIDSSGCTSLISSETNIIVHQLPSIPELNLNHDTLVASKGYASYLWFWNGFYLGSSPENYWIAALEGNYTVQVKDSFQCTSNLSLPVNFVRTATNQINTSIAAFRLHPNPAYDFMILESNQTNIAGKINYTIISIQNKEIRSSVINDFKDSSRIDISDLQPGMYWINVHLNKHLDRLAFIKASR